MPELPEVETVVRTLRPRLIGRTIAAVATADRRVLRTPIELRPVRVAAVERVGKYIRVHLADDRRVLTVHLGMAGRLIVAPADSPPPKHAYLRLRLDAPPGELRFVNPRWCMGGVWLAEAGGAADPVCTLGADPLRISRADFAALLRRHRRQIKALLLDQTALAGMGNIYCDESLFAAGIHPRAIAARLSAERASRLWTAMRMKLAQAIRRGGSTLRDYRNADDQPGWFQLSLSVYGRTGENCPRCRRPIRHATTAGRSTHFCPRCQRK